MKIVHIVPGAGGTYYCENCMRDCSLVKALRRQGHDVVMVPMYLPILVDTQGISGDVPVFFGGVNVYLQQQFGLFRKTPRWLDKLFDSKWMLRFAAAREGTTEAAGLGPMTLSMLQGPDGNQKKELDRLLDWLKNEEKPDAVHLSNSLLLGLAKELKAALDVPVLCTLQDEEPWLDAIDPPWDQQCWDAMAECAEYVDAFISVSQWYADEMTRRMKLAPDHIRVVPLGVEFSNGSTSELSMDPPVIGYLAKMTASLGLGVLVDAFIELKSKPELSGLKLRATGGQLGSDVAYAASLKEKLRKHGFAEDADFVDVFDAEHRPEFLSSLTVLSVPAPQGEAFGMFIAESLAAGVPVVQPDAGGFREVIEATGGGIIYEEKTPQALAAALESLLLDPERLRALGARGRESVAEHFNIDRMAKDMGEVYESLV